MKKTYEKPVLSKRQKLSSVVANASNPAPKHRRTDHIGWRADRLASQIYALAELSFRQIYPSA
ncbi:hypothetical protein [Mesorhizobium sp. B2-8-5]|uniref:hypothetical protein n=1 Tax=Mesorhizobium sp. B2-8-5 TaxID=2589903 RepID=UPI00112D8F7C|nr:hypothetical protein [Mesorhizobium sp. B2-8-5]UCI24756.1 hypothetical protein FJ430_24710 [Mesorhizobium sp. B2-8-5]